MGDTGRDNRRWLVAIVLSSLLLAYIGSYLVLSRRGFAQTERAFGEGFYFFLPEDTISWRLLNYGCVVVYYPLIAIDNWLGTGRCVASPPTFRLSSLDIVKRGGKRRWVAGVIWAEKGKAIGCRAWSMTVGGLS